MAESAAARTYFAVEITFDPSRPVDPDLVLAEVDAFSPTAAQDVDDGTRVFFGSRQDRDRACDHLRASLPGATVASLDVPDEQWAERSQAALRAVTVGQITIAPPWDRPNDPTGVIVILPSMGFGTGHHASTRLCLSLLQQIDATDRRVCDVGTGSGVLALAALERGAREVLAIDYDADAVACAQESAALNDVTRGLTIRQVDLDADTSVEGEPFDIVLANLTGGLLLRLASRLVQMTGHRGQLVLSGITSAEAEDVVQAFTHIGCDVERRADEDSWVGLVLSPH